MHRIRPLSLTQGHPMLQAMRSAHFSPPLVKLSVATLSVLAAAATTACSAGHKSQNQSGQSQGSMMPTPADTSGLNNAAFSSDVVKCTNFSSGYPGDNECIVAPDAAAGFQFHYGPASYTDTNEVAKYVLMPGDETTDCLFFPTPNADDVYFNEYHSRMRPGSHHMLLYVQPANGAPRTSSAPEPCNQGLQTRNLFGATSPEMDVKDIDPAPENVGLAVKIPPTQQAVMQMHVINATDKPILKESWANIVYTDPSTVKELADPIFFIAGVSMSIQVGQTVINKGTATVPQNAASNFRLVAAIPHIHAHTPKFTAYKTIGGQKELLLQQFGVLDVPTDPHIVFFDSVLKNPPADEASHTDGAYSGTVYLKPGDTIDWECEQTNDGVGANGKTFTTPLRFTEQAYTGEMCNMFGLYAPSTGSAWQGLGL